MIKKLLFATLLGLALCCTTSCTEEHIDYSIEWVLTPDDYSGSNFEEYMSEWSTVSKTFYDAFDTEFATVGDFTPGIHACIIHDGKANKVEKLAKEHAENAAKKVNVSVKYNTYKAKCYVHTFDKEDVQVWSTVYGK